MPTPKKMVRTNQALKVLKLTTDGMTIVSACREVGIRRGAFYRFINHNPGIMDTIKELQLASNLNQLLRIFENQLNVLEELMLDGLSKDTPPRERLLIAKYLERRLDQLVGELPIAIDGVLESHANPIPMPKVMQAKSTFERQM